MAKHGSATNGFVARIKPTSRADSFAVATLHRTMKNFFGYVIRRAIYDTARNQLRPKPTHAPLGFTITAPNKPSFWFRLGAGLRAVVLFVCFGVLLVAVTGLALLIVALIVGIL
jgi:hypothetical protein